MRDWDYDDEKETFMTHGDTHEDENAFSYQIASILLVAVLVSVGLLILVRNAIADTETYTKATPEEESVVPKLWSSEHMTPL